MSHVVHCRHEQRPRAGHGGCASTLVRFEPRARAHALAVRPNKQTWSVSSYTRLPGALGNVEPNVETAPRRGGAQQRPTLAQERGRMLRESEPRRTSAGSCPCMVVFSSKLKTTSRLNVSIVRSIPSYVRRVSLKQCWHVARPRFALAGAPSMLPLNLPPWPLTVPVDAVTSPPVRRRR